MEPTMERLEKEGFWKQKHKGVVEMYIGDEEGLAYEYVFEKLKTMRGQAAFSPSIDPKIDTRIL